MVDLGPDACNFLWSSLIVPDDELVLCSAFWMYAKWCRWS